MRDRVPSKTPALALCFACIACGGARHGDAVALTAEACTIRVGPIISFEVFRGAYSPDGVVDDSMGEDHFDAHGRCLLDVRVGEASRRYLHVVTGFAFGGPHPEQQQCADARESIAEHLMILTDRCRDPDGRGVLTAGDEAS